VVPALCPDCHQGQLPAEVELDIENTEFSPGVRRMHALVGGDAPFDHGRQEMKILAGLEVRTESVERIAEAIEEHIDQREQEEMQEAIQLAPPVVVGKPIPVLYVEMDGTGAPVVSKETVGRQAKTDGQPAHTREVKLGCVFRASSRGGCIGRRTHNYYIQLRCHKPRAVSLCREATMIS
jgi:hypothetical protein